MLADSEIDHVKMTHLCSKCQSIANNNPFGMLYRKDEHGAFLLCGPCRQGVYHVNNLVADGHISFVFEKPRLYSEGKEPQCSKNVHVFPGPKRCPQWNCHKCNKLIFSTPRAYEGFKEKEPVDWWWCRSCQLLRVQNEAAGIAKTRLDMHAKRKKAKIDICKQQLTPQVSHGPLDKWLQPR